MVNLAFPENTICKIMIIIRRSKVENRHKWNNIPGVRPVGSVQWSPCMWKLVRQSNVGEYYCSISALIVFIIFGIFGNDLSLHCPIHLSRVEHILAMHKNVFQSSNYYPSVLLLILSEENIKRIQTYHNLLTTHSTSQLTSHSTTSLCIKTHLPQYHSSLHREHRLAAGAPHRTHFGGSLTKLSTNSSVYISTNLKMTV